MLLESVGDADAVLTMITDQVDDQLLEAAPGLRVVSQMAVGVDNVDLDACVRRGIQVGHTPDVLTETTADTAFALLAASVRRIPEGIDVVREGRWGPWDPSSLLGGDLHDTTIGIVGLGRIGAAVARRAVGFAMRILYTGPGRKPHLESELGAAYRTLDELLAEADHVVLTAPLTEDTRHLISGPRLRRMKRTATLVNIGRGPLVDPDALVEALRDGVIARAALDVTEPEPLPSDHPLVSMPSCLVVPHIGSASVRTRRAMADLAVANLVAGLEGRPLPARIA
jgi:lactate dehydrogenase-like 2-hydroxyacid dehydrogenase